jgi:hypothetical protein
MRFCFVFLCWLGAVAAAPSTAQAACPGFVAAETIRDKAVDDKVHSSKLTGAKAQSAIAGLKKGVADAAACMSTGSPADRAATLGVIAQLRWNQACVLSYDGVPSDKAAAVAIAKASDRDIDAFSAKTPSLSGDARALFGNWEHFDGDIESGDPGSCL